MYLFKKRFTDKMGIKPGGKWAFKFQTFTGSYFNAPCPEIIQYIRGPQIISQH